MDKRYYMLLLMEQKKRVGRLEGCTMVNLTRVHWLASNGKNMANNGHVGWFTMVNHMLIIYVDSG